MKYSIKNLCYVPLITTAAKLTNTNEVATTHPPSTSLFTLSTITTTPEQLSSYGKKVSISTVKPDYNSEKKNKLRILKASTVSESSTVPEFIKWLEYNPSLYSKIIFFSN